MFSLLSSVTLFISFSSTLIHAYSPVNPCPIQCSKAGNDPRKWTQFHGVPALERCKEPILFDTAIFTPIDAPDAHITLRACTASTANTTQEMEYNPAPFTFGSPVARRQSTNQTQSTNSTQVSNSTLAYTKLGALEGCNAEPEGIKNNTLVHTLQWRYGRNGVLANKGEVLAAVQKLQAYMQTQPNCGSVIMFSHFQRATVGLYIGSSVLNSDAQVLVEAFEKAANADGEVSSLATEMCRENTPASWTAGIFADYSKNVSSAQEALAEWAQGRCLSGYDNKDEGQSAPVTFIKRTSIPQEPIILSGYQQNNTQVSSISKRTVRTDLRRRDTCQYLKIEKGDICPTLAQECGISQTQFVKLNDGGDSLWCNNLKVDSYVCCNKGDLPDFTPQPNGDGSCASYVVIADDNCSKIAEAHFITPEDIEKYNKKTWGWAGCALQPGQKICLSKGNPPMPAAVEGAQCGPTVPGTSMPTDGKELKDLNPCPLNVCCNVWGNCGLTDDFCVEAPADSGAPGTSQPGKNGCIASCGMEITNNDSPPKQFRKVAYFEAWNKDRPCLHMDVTDIDKEKYTHVHFAFPDITPDYRPDVSKLQEQFDKFKKMSGIKRIVSFGGWAFSTEAATFNIFRSGVTDANRLLLAENIAQFVIDNGLDGVDFDWEYPAAPDIPGIPAGELEAGKQYLAFLKLVKRRLSNKEVAIAAPASYWYLKGMPIKDISEVIDYFVYMTYDLHGQWDYGNRWASVGCDEGNCLRSHINSTETKNALAMVTKAGVKSNKVIVGIASYGRSFYMEEAGCDGPDCHFTGSATESDATPGVCTDTGGYISNAEIRQIISEGLQDRSGVKVKTWHDAGSNTDLMVYNDNDWVAYMSDTTKKTRTDWYKGLNFGGTSDWAVDLDKDYGSSGVGNAEIDISDEELQRGGGPNCNEKDKYDTIDKVANDDTLYPACATLYTLSALQRSLQMSYVNYDRVNEGYDSKFKSYANYMKKALPEKLRLWAHWLDGDGQKYFDCHFEGNGDKWDGQCPVPRSVRGNLLIGIWTITMKLRDKEGFYEALGKDVGAVEDWIKFDKYEQETMCNPSPCNKLELTVYGMPYLKDDFEFPDPKDIVVKAMSNVNNLDSQITARTVDIGMGQWDGPDEDVIQTLAIPVFMVENAIEGMENAKEIGEDIQEDEAKNRIIMILSFVFMIIPFLGEVAAIAAGMATLARVIAIAGIGANAGLTIKDVIDNPEMAPFAIMELLTAGRLKSPKDYLKAIDFRKAMKASDIEQMGESFVKKDATIQKIIKPCAKKW